MCRPTCAQYMMIELYVYSGVCVCRSLVHFDECVFSLTKRLLLFNKLFV